MSFSMIKSKALPCFPLRQRGVGVLLVAIVLLGIATVMTLFSLSAGLYEQRTATNETRYKLAYQTAQAGIDQGLELVKANTSNTVSCWLFPGMSRCTAGESARWARCSATDRTSPCGAIEPQVANSTIRANYLYYTDSNGRATGADVKTLNLALSPVNVGGTSVGQALTKIGDFPVDYEVNALLCLIDTATPSNQCLTQAEYKTAYGNNGLPGGTPSTPTGSNNIGYGINTYSSSGLFAVTLVSRSRLVGASATTDTENAQVVLRATTAAYRIIGAAPDVPLVASSSVTGLGNGEIVTNPNGGGTGIPLSIWSASTIHVDSTSGGGNSNASFATCYSDEFFKTGTTSQYDGSTICPSSGSGACSCSAIANMVGNGKSPYGLGVISGHFGTNAVTGADLLGVGVNGILPDAQYFPLTPLNVPPNQLNNTPFEYTFGHQVADQDSVLLASADDATVDEATSWMNTMGFQDLPDCASLTSASYGFYWHNSTEGDCNLPSAQVGTPSLPVVLVTQSDFSLSAQTVYFGIIFVRSPATVGQSVATSGTYKVKVTGNPQVYGSMIVEGEVDTAGGMQLIYDANTLNNVINGPGNTRMGILPGSWSDAGQIDVTTKTYSEN